MGINRAIGEYEQWLRKQCDVDELALRRKRERMAESEHALLRGAFHRWFDWFRRLPDEVVRAPKLLSPADVHVENFGTWRDAEGRLVWGVNDLDEASVVPFTSDLVRLACSASLAGGLDTEDVVTVVADGYRVGLDKGGARVIVDPGDYLARASRRAAKRAASDRQRDGDSPMTEAEVPDCAAKALADCLPDGSSAVSFFRRRAGLGSLGRPRFVAIGIWRGGAVVREAKVIVPSSYAYSRGKAGTALPGADMTTIANSAGRPSDPSFSVRSGWSVRRRLGDTAKIEWEDIGGSEDQKRYVRDMAQELGALHRISDHDARARHWLDGGKRQWLADAADEVIEMVREDFSRLDS